MTVRSNIEKFYDRKTGNRVESSVTTSQILLYRLSLITVFVVAMEWTNYRMHMKIIGLMKSGRNVKQIHMQLKPLKESECFVYRVLALYNYSGDIAHCQRSGQPRTALTKMVVEAVRACINQNPRRRQKTIAKKMNIALRTLSHISKEDLQVSCSLHNRALRYERAKKLLRLYGKGKYKKILITNEKIFTIEQKLSRQNDKVYARYHLKPQKKSWGSSMLATPLTWWYGGEYCGTVLLLFIFVRKGWKHRPLCIRSPFWSYHEALKWYIVRRSQLDLSTGLCGAHIAKSTQKWPEENILNFICKEDWTAGSPDLNPLDYEILEKFKEMAYKKPHCNLELLKSSLE